MPPAIGSGMIPGGTPQSSSGVDAIAAQLQALQAKLAELLRQLTAAIDALSALMTSLPPRPDASAGPEALAAWERARARYQAQIDQLTATINQLEQQITEATAQADALMKKLEAAVRTDRVILLMEAKRRAQSIAAAKQAAEFRLRTIASAGKGVTLRSQLKQVTYSGPDGRLQSATMMVPLLESAARAPSPTRSRP